MLLLSLIAVIRHNYSNPDQNPEYKVSTSKLPIMQLEEETIENVKINLKRKKHNDFAEIYNKYDKNSWQRYALNEEQQSLMINNKSMNFNHDIQDKLEIINEYELNLNLETTVEDYKKAKIKIAEYIKALDSDNWQEYTKLKIKNLTEIKKEASILEEDIKEINLEIEAYQMRLDYNISYANDMLNQYIEIYRKETFRSIYYEDSDENYYMKCRAKSELARYAIENKIEQDISPEKFNLILNNKVDARISFVRTFEYFNIFVVIIGIYIATTILTEETNKGTIKSLLTKPHKRSTILISKILACVITIIITMIFLIVAQYIVGGITFGFDSYGLNYIGYDYNSEQIVNLNLFIYVILVAVSKLPIYIIIILFCIFMGTINNHTSMTMILTLIIFSICSTVISEWSKLEKVGNLTKYLITNNWDFSTYLFGQSSNIEGINFGFSVFIYLIYVIFLLSILINKFNKKEINKV